MSCQLVALTFDATDPAGLARFWAASWAGRSRTASTHARRRSYRTMTPDSSAIPPTDKPKAGKNYMHFDLTSTSLDDQRQTVDRALAFGGRHIDIGQRPEQGHVVLADPEGNEFCVIEPGNAVPC